MNLPFICDKTFKKQTYTINPLPKAEYNNCQFIDCEFSEAFLSYIAFTECEFINCNLSSAKVKDASFNDVVFKGCKLQGVLFQYCNPFLLALSFENCVLNLSTFNDLKLKKTLFNSCMLKQTDFSNTDLSYSTFLKCNLEHASFYNANLSYTDFTTSQNITLNPEFSNLKSARFSSENVLGLLKCYKLIIE
ncbi:pentapeptide repeat-containing protein [Bizionia echini]|uniref:pentapeptide repeat-containing protein n=1 Tax=Bizionia echini TaxID=649333 RepID=UPI0030DB1363|tara:strand:+ start:86 stop:658 length:573 start_codon:yes stop_codon:yes gene_type:complete